MRKITTLLFALCVAVSMAQAKSQASAPANKPNIQPDAQRPIATRLKNSPALVKAAQANDLEKVKKLLNKGADPNSIAEVKLEDNYKAERHPLGFAVENNNMEMVDTLLDAGADIDSDFGFGMYPKFGYPWGMKDITPLIYAVQTGNEDLAQTFIDKGANINKASSGNITPLSTAISKNDTKLMNWLLDKGATVTAKELSKANEEQLNLFLGKGIDINTKDEDGTTALLYALKEFRVTDHNHKQVVLLISRGADIYVVGPQGTTLDYAVSSSNNDRQIMRFLSQKGIKLNERRKTGVLWVMATSCDKETILALVNAGADVNYSRTNSEGTRSALDDAARCKNGTYELLSSLGAVTGEQIAQQRGKSTLEKIDSVVNVVGGAALGAVAVRAQQIYTPKSTTRTVTTTVVEEGVEAASNATATTCAEQCRQSAAENAHIHYRGATGTVPYCTCDVCDDRLQKC